MTPHVHADLIKAWADGAIIQFYTTTGWIDCTGNMPEWNEKRQYRIKPEEILLEGIPLKVGDIIYYKYSHIYIHVPAKREVTAFDKKFIWTKDCVTGESWGNNYHHVYTRTSPREVVPDEALTKIPEPSIKVWSVDLWSETGVRELNIKAYPKDTTDRFLQRGLLFSTKEGALRRFESITNEGKKP